MIRILAVIWAAAVCLGGAEARRVSATQYVHSYHQRHAVLARVAPGDVIATKTLDASGRDEAGKAVAAGGNPLTGPFYIEGAEPGDAIAVTFRKIRLNRSWGYSGYRLGLYSLTPAAVEGVYPNQYKEGAAIPGRSNAVPWDLDLTKQTVRLREPVSKVLKMEFPARPMLGCVGVAAAGDFGPSSTISGPYGGNMDYNELVEGTTLVLPVYHAGGLLFLGDGHALMGDGEATGTGVETSMDVEFSVSVRKKAGLTNPRLETASAIVSIGSQPEFVSALDHALQIATADMVEWLKKDYGVEPWAAHLLIGAQARYDVITVGGSVGLRLSRSVLPGR